MKAKELIGILSKNPNCEVLIVGWYMDNKPVLQSIDNSHVLILDDKVILGAEPLECAKYNILIENPAEKPKIEDGPKEAEN